jgi:hypothetical protein
MKPPCNKCKREPKQGYTLVHLCPECQKEAQRSDDQLRKAVTPPKNSGWKIGWEK